MPETYSTVK